MEEVFCRTIQDHGDLQKIHNQPLQCNLLSSLWYLLYTIFLPPRHQKTYLDCWFLTPAFGQKRYKRHLLRITAHAAYIYLHVAKTEVLLIGMLEQASARIHNHYLFLRSEILHSAAVCLENSGLLLLKRSIDSLCQLHQNNSL